MSCPCSSPFGYDFMNILGTPKQTALVFLDFNPPPIVGSLTGTN